MEDVADRQRKRFSMTTRRWFLFTVFATLIFGPPVVPAKRLMPVRDMISPTERNHYGYVERLYVHVHLPKITELQHNGLSAPEIAAELNRLGITAINGSTWDAQHVLGVVKRNERIRRADEILRAERQISELSGQERAFLPPKRHSVSTGRELPFHVRFRG